jgi:hypothetical protein
MNVDWRANRLVATMHIGQVGETVVRVAWFDFDTSGDAPVLTQSGVINQGPDVHTYFSAIAVNASGDLGLTFMEPSTTEPISMYVTGQPAFAYGSGKMLPPVVVAVGQGNYSGGRGGDYAGMGVDPEMGNVFWAANMYKAQGLTSMWGTRIASFVVDAARPPVAGLIAVHSSHQAAAPPTAVEAPGAGPLVPPEPARVVSVFGSAGDENMFEIRLQPRSPQWLGADDWAGLFDREGLQSFDLV